MREEKQTDRTPRHQENRGVHMYGATGTCFCAHGESRPYRGPGRRRSKMATDTSRDAISRQLRVGVTRVRDVDGFVGTVLYVGPVPSAKDDQEVYAGIAWDDASRGKHDGSVICRTTNQLVRLFSCEGGSFLRLSKLDLGVSLDPALLQSKYVALDSPVVAPNNLLPHTARTTSGREKPIELLGELKIRKRQQLEDLDKISLRSLGIARATTDESMSKFSHLKEIDLAGNLLSDWDTVFCILRQFPLLENVSLASNRIMDVPPQPLDAPCDLDKVRILNLNRCSLTFRTIEWIANAMPHLEELCVAYNDLSDVEDGSITGFRSLFFLDCSSCNLTSWKDQVQCFGKLPSLQHLMVNDNSIPDVSMASVGTSCFKNLRSLQLAGTNIASWQDLDGIRTFESLKSLRFRNTPLTSSMGAGEARSITIARIPNLAFLNASPISSKERVEAERRYVSNVARELLLVASSAVKNGSKDEILALHPRFEELVETHKESMAATQTSVNGGLTLEPVNVTIRSMAAASCSMEPLQKRLPGGLKVGRLKAMCLRTFGLDTERQVLHFKAEDDPFPTELDDDEHTLSYYGVCDGAEVLMNEIDFDARQRDEARMAEEHNQRLAEQERDARALQELQRTEGKVRTLAIEKAAQPTG